MDLATVTLWLGDDDATEELKLTLPVDVEMSLSDEDRQAVVQQFREVVGSFSSWIDQHYGGNQDIRRLDAARSTLMRNRDALVNAGVQSGKIDTIADAISSLDERAEQERERRWAEFQKRRTALAAKGID